MIVRVLDGARTKDLAARLEFAYQRLALTLAENVPGWSGHRWEIAVNQGEPSVLFLSGELDSPLSSQQKRAVWQALAERLREVRRQIEGQVDAVPLFLTADPFEPGFFECQPDAWIVFGGNDEPVQVSSVVDRDAEIERRRKQMAPS